MPCLSILNAGLNFRSGSCVFPGWVESVLFGVVMKVVATTSELKDVTGADGRVVEPVQLVKDAAYYGLEFLASLEGVQLAEGCWLRGLTGLMEWCLGVMFPKQLCFVDVPQGLIDACLGISSVGLVFGVLFGLGGCLELFYVF